MSDRIKNLGKYAHKPKIDVGSSEDDMSANVKSKVNSKLTLPQCGQRTTKHKAGGGGGVRG